MGKDRKPRCPHCGRYDCVPYVAFRNVENYGDSAFNVHCTGCGRVVRVSLCRTVKVSGIYETDEEESDFAEF